MNYFYLVQRGIFRSKIDEQAGLKGLVKFDSMCSSEFQFGALPKSFRRMMYHFEDYEIFNTGIFTPELDELVVFCNSKYEKEVIGALHEFITKPWSLKEYSELEKIPKIRSFEAFYCCSYTNFWWCIDNNIKHGDWMAFFLPKASAFSRAMKIEYENWWLKMLSSEREKEYKIACD